MNLSQPISSLKGVGPYYLKKLSKLGIKTIQDLLWHFPSRYEDFSNVKKIKDLQQGEVCSIIGRVERISSRRAWRKRMFLTEAVLADETGNISAIWFSQPYLTRTIPKGALVSLAGKVQFGPEGLYLSHPAYEILDRGTKKLEIGNCLPSGDPPKGEKLEIKNLRHTAGLIPIYPETHGITSRALRFLIQPILPEAIKLPDILPPELRKKLGLLEFRHAIKEIHFPQSEKLAEASRRRFAFEELFFFQLLLENLRKKSRKLSAPVIKQDVGLIKKFLATLPFELTRDQKQAAWEILKDISKPFPMNRLLNGDVGSGKTLVATIAALETISQKYQVAMLAPTEILARQHFEKISKFLEPFDLKIALFVSKDTQISDEGLRGKVRRKNLLEKLSGSEPYFVIGTHALIQKEVKFPKLALVIVDEQHRFGIKQRAHLTKSEKVPHLLSMTATPIPRTLALSLYGDLDISILREMPKGRQKIISKVIPPARRPAAYDFIREQIIAGRQAFIICPRIEVIGKTFEEYLLLDTKAVKQEYERLSLEVFPDLKLLMLHGRLKSEEKESIMSEFSQNKAPVLVSTSVVEVGVDIPNATVMMIEGADRFGLAQLHQFRGRVGRGSHQSYCFLLTDSPGKAVKSRLEAFAKVSDGFTLAEEDLKNRGPGEFFGERQSGLPDLAMTSLKDLALLELARREAKSLLEKDRELKTTPLLKIRLEEFKQEVHLE